VFGPRGWGGHELDVPRDGGKKQSLRGLLAASKRRCGRSAAGGELVGAWSSGGASVLLESQVTTEEAKVSQPDALSDLANDRTVLRNLRGVRRTGRAEGG